MPKTRAMVANMSEMNNDNLSHSGESDSDLPLGEQDGEAESAMEVVQNPITPEVDAGMSIPDKEKDALETEVDLRVQVSERPNQVGEDSASSGEEIGEEDKSTAVTLESTDNEERRRTRKSKKKMYPMAGPSRISLSDREDRVVRRTELRLQHEISLHKKRYDELNHLKQRGQIKDAALVKGAKKRNGGEQLNKEKSRGIQQELISRK